MARVLILYATREGQTAKVAERIGAAGHSVERADAAANIAGLSGFESRH